MKGNGPHGGVNPLAAAQEARIEVKNYAMSTVMIPIRDPCETLIYWSRKSKGSQAPTAATIGRGTAEAAVLKII